MELSEIRKEIDEVDGEIRKLFERRMVLADKVATVKAQTEDVIYKPEREDEIIHNLTENVDDSIKMEYTALIKRIMELSRKYQYGRTLKLRNCLDIKYLEIEPKIYSAATIKSELYIVDSISKDNVITVDDHEDLAEIILSGKCSAGIAIMENIGVDVSDGLHKILTNNNLFINRCDIVIDGIYRKKVVTFTRDLVVLPKHNRLKIMFVCKNRSGSLSSILSMISDYGVNLTEIHSKPYIEGDWNYVFMVEMTASLLMEAHRALIYQLMNETDEFKILGSYTCTD
ncbi:MAG: chorismate mutase [Eubacterium sp.]|nr:chorismate mutase [Eubacterium sp.]